MAAVSLRARHTATALRRPPQHPTLGEPHEARLSWAREKGTALDIDFALSLDFVDQDATPYQMRFRHETPDTGQLLGIITKDRPDTGRVLEISFPGVRFDDVVTALADWRDWARLTDDTIDLSAIRQRIIDAGLGCSAEELVETPYAPERGDSWHSEDVEPDLCPIFPVRYA